MGQSKSIREAILTFLGTRIPLQSVEIFNFGPWSKLVKPLENQSFFLVIPIIQLSPSCLPKRRVQLVLAHTAFHRTVSSPYGELHFLSAK